MDTINNDFTAFLSSFVFEIALIFCIIIVSLFAFVYMITTTNDSLAYAAPTLKDANLEIEIVSTGLNVPTSMAFIGPNDILVLEKNKGTVQRVKDGIILPQPLLDVNVATNSERGMLGIDVLQIPTPILPPTSRLFNVFLYFTEAQSNDGGAAIANRLYKYSFIDDPRLGGAQGRMFGPKLLLDLPVTPGPNHDGGKVWVDPEGNVNLITGDLNRQGKVQNFENGPDPDGTSAILRVTPEGARVGSGILGASHPIDKYIAYGIRNSFGFTYDPLTFKIWTTENGPASNDEINLAGFGFNSGWRDLMGMAPEGFDFNNLVDFDGRGKYSDPEFVWTQTVAPTDIEFFNSNKLGTVYQNDMFVGDFNNGRIYNFDLNSERTALVLSGALSDKVADTDSETQDVIFGEGFGGVSDLKTGPSDGFLYVLSIGLGTIYRIVPVQ